MVKRLILIILGIAFARLIYTILYAVFGFDICYLSLPPRCPQLALSVIVIFYTISLALGLLFSWLIISILQKLLPRK